MTVPDQSKDNRNTVRTVIFCLYVCKRVDLHEIPIKSSEISNVIFERNDGRKNARRVKKIVLALLRRSCLKTLSSGSIRSPLGRINED